MVRELDPDAGVPLALIVDDAYDGVAAGSALFSRSSEDGGDVLRLAVLVRPEVPMGQLVAVPPVAAMAVLDALVGLGADVEAVGIGWPQDLVLADGHEFVTTIGSQAGYAEGMFVAISCDLPVDCLAALRVSASDLEIAEAVATAVARRVDAWVPAACGDSAKAGAWAPFLEEYFDHVVLAGKPVDVCYPNGAVYARGTFAGLDIWGRATVRTVRAGELEFPAQQYSIRPQTID